MHWIKASKNGKPLAVVEDPTITFGEPSHINSAIERAVVTAPDATSKKNYMKVSVLDRAFGLMLLIVMIIIKSKY